MKRYNPSGLQLTSCRAIHQYAAVLEVDLVILVVALHALVLLALVSEAHRDAASSRGHVSASRKRVAI